MTAKPEGVLPFGQLPKSVLDQIHSGIYPASKRTDVVNAVVGVMMAAHWREVPKSIVIRALLNTDNRLARQLAFNGRKELPKDRIRKLLDTKWEFSAQIVRDAKAKGFVHAEQLIIIREYFNQYRGDLTEPELNVMVLLLSEGDRRGNVNVAAPARWVGEALGIDRTTAHALMRDLAVGGRWLRLKSRGLPGTSGKANIYRLIPAAGRKEPVTFAPPRQSADIDLPGEQSLCQEPSKSMSASLSGKSMSAAQEPGTYKSMSAHKSMSGDKSMSAQHEDHALSVDEVEGRADQCIHGLQLMTPGRESAFDRGRHAQSQKPYDNGDACWKMAT